MNKGVSDPYARIMTLIFTLLRVTDGCYVSVASAGVSYHLYFVAVENYVYPIIQGKLKKILVSAYDYSVIIRQAFRKTGGDRKAF